MANRAYLISNTENTAIAFENLTDECVLVAFNYHIPMEEFCDYVSNSRIGDALRNSIRGEELSGNLKTLSKG